MEQYYKKDGIEVRTSIRDDVEKLKNNLRDSDISEVWESNHHSPAEALMISFNISIMCLTLVFQDEVIAMFGIVPGNILAENATIWLLASDRLEKIRRRFVRHSKSFIKIFLSLYPRIENYVSVKNKESIKWLEMCGAKFGSPMNYGAEQQLFQYFYFER